MTKTPQVPAMPGTAPLGMVRAENCTGNPVYVIQAMAVKRGMEFYLRTGMRVNTAYTPKNMLATAGKITGEDYGAKWNAKTAAKAIAGLEAWIIAQHKPQT